MLGKNLSVDPSSSKAKAAYTACKTREPEDYQEREARKDPELFLDHVREQIRCMRAGGLKIIVTDAKRANGFHRRYGRTGHELANRQSLRKAGVRLNQYPPRRTDRRRA